MKAQIMPTSLFKSKLHSLIHKLSSPTIPLTQSRKLSDAASVGTYESSKSMTDKLRHTLQRNRSTSQTSTTLSTDRYADELKQFHSAYLLAVEELDFAKDSVGSPYYSGDLLAAHEALDDSIRLFMQLLEHILDPVTRDSLRAQITPKLNRLQSALTRLPKDKIATCYPPSEIPLDF
ncbi:hypothetical protein BY458DRAFT_514883 [Sporodiniella umbellata]|nr:hypothetical protein BY458DRAFT_514883 [Sporodiniella umbellata]